MKPGATYAVIGGLGALGILLAVYLSREGRKHVLRGLPPPDFEWPPVGHRRAHGRSVVCPECRVEFEVGGPQPPAFRSSADVYRTLLKTVKNRKQESFWAFFVDARNRVIGQREICKGSLASCMVHPREIFAPAIQKRAAAMIVAHNHPSGDPEPSPEDQALTQRLQDAGKLIGIPVLDHIVVSSKGYYTSFRDRGFIK